MLERLVLNFTSSLVCFASEEVIILDDSRNDFSELDRISLSSVISSFTSSFNVVDSNSNLFAHDIRELPEGGLTSLVDCIGSSKKVSKSLE